MVLDVLRVIRFTIVMDLKKPHIFEHSNVTCDILAYGSMRSMGVYCSLYEKYDAFNKENETINHESLLKNDIHATRTGNVVQVSHEDSLYYFICSYPERMLQKMFRDYMVVTTRTICSAVVR